jgi:N-acetyl-1-D-myo-inositol-2-amino-2-deoxy-alpha-D-glucopyranoside deacetylase
MPDHRMVLVHAHPDDETISTGATMASYADAGVGVTLVTCTLGEEGEVLVPELASLAADRDDALGQHRIGELAAAMEVLGVTDHRFLGGPGRWRDSGMMGTPQNDRPDCFWRADPDEAADALVAVLREVRPQVLVTYDAFGGYGHPDHIQDHRVSMRAWERAADPAVRPDLGPAWLVAKVYQTCLPRSVLAEHVAAMNKSGSGFFGLDDPSAADTAPNALDDALVTTCVDALDYEPRKMRALAEHHTQVTVDGPFFALSNNVGQVAWGREYFQLVHGEVAGPFDASGRETGLFNGVAAEPA